MRMALLVLLKLASPSVVHPGAGREMTVWCETTVSWRGLKSMLEASREGAAWPLAGSAGPSGTCSRPAVGGLRRFEVRVTSSDDAQTLCMKNRFSVAPLPRPPNTARGAHVL